MHRDTISSLLHELFNLMYEYEYVVHSHALLPPPASTAGMKLCKLLR